MEAVRISTQQLLHQSDAKAMQCRVVALGGSTQSAIGFVGRKTDRDRNRAVVGESNFKTRHDRGLGGFAVTGGLFRFFISHWWCERFDVGARLDLQVQSGFILVKD